MRLRRGGKREACGRCEGDLASRTPYNHRIVESKGYTQRSHSSNLEQGRLAGSALSLVGNSALAPGPACVLRQRSGGDLRSSQGLHERRFPVGFPDKHWPVCCRRINTAQFAGSPVDPVSEVPMRAGHRGEESGFTGMELPTATQPLASGRDRTPRLPPSGHGFLPRLEGAALRGLRLPSRLRQVAVAQHSVRTEGGVNLGAPMPIRPGEGVFGPEQAVLDHGCPFASPTCAMSGPCQSGLSSAADPWADRAVSP